MSLSGTGPNAGRQSLTRGHFAWLTLAYFAFVVYGSLVPLQFHEISLAEAIDRFHTVLTSPLQVPSRSDFTTNVLVFVLLSYLLLTVLSVDRSWIARLGSAVVIVPSCTLLSAAVEFFQVFTATRTPALTDIVAESIGALLGAVVWIGGGQRITQGLRSIWESAGIEGPAAWLLGAYIVLLLVLHLLPFELTLSPVEIYHKYKAGRVHLLPLAGAEADPGAALQRIVATLIYFYPVGVLLTQFPGPGWRNAKNWPRVVGAGFAAAAGIEVLQLFELSRNFEPGDVLTGGLAVLAGWGLAHCYRSSPSRWISPITLGSVWLGVVLLFNWLPFDFVGDWAAVAGRLDKVSLLPLADYYLGTEPNALEQLVLKTLLFLPVGGLLAPAKPRSASGLQLLAVVAAGGLVAVGAEAGQLFLASRYPSITDVVVGTVATWAGYLVVCRGRGAESRRDLCYARGEHSGHRKRSLVAVLQGKSS